MNSTQWATLTDFVKYLGRTGKCKVDETEKGWFITYIDREPETLLKESLKNKRQKADIADGERHEREIEQQIEKAVKSVKPNGTPVEPNLEDREVRKRSEDEKIAFSFGAARSKTGDGPESSGKGFEPTLFRVDEEKKGESKDLKSRLHGLSRQSDNGRVGAAALDELMKEDEKAKERMNRKDFWLAEELVVKVMSKSLADKGFYKQKGVVKKVIGKYVGEIKMLESETILRVDQEELETVIPQIGSLVKIVNGAYRGSTAKLLSIDTSKFTAKVQIEKGIYDGRIVNAIEYEDICKFSS